MPDAMLPQITTVRFVFFFKIYVSYWTDTFVYNALTLLNIYFRIEHVEIEKETSKSI